MNELLYFDCHASFGPRPKKHLEARWTLEHLLEDLDLAGIAGALVTYSQSLHYDPMLSNLRLIEQIKGHRDTLYPCWVALPAMGPDFPAVEQFIAQMREHDVRAVRIDPNRFGVPVCQALWRPLIQALADEGILICTSMSDAAGSFEKAHATLSLFEGCNVLLLDADWGQFRYALHLMQLHPQLHLSFSAFQSNRVVEHFAQRFGPERCLFGSNLPHMAPGAARGFFDWSLLDREQVSQMTGKNLKRLLAGRGPDTVPQPGQWHDTITAATRAGQPLPCLTLDAHCHMLHEGAQTAGERLIMLDGGPDGMYELAQRVGIDRTAVMSWAGPLCMDTDLGNAHVEAAVNKYPGHFLGLPTVNPEHDSPEKIEQIIQKYLVELKYPGLKTYTSPQNLKYDDPLFDRFFSYANEHGLYAVIDPSGVMDDQEMTNLATKFPKMGIHLDHCGQSWPYARWAAKLMKQHANIWAQINRTAVTNGVLEYLVEQVGPDRVLFGTDAPMRDPRPQAAWVVFTRLTEADKRKILGENFANILRDIGINL